MARDKRTLRQDSGSCRSDVDVRACLKTVARFVATRLPPGSYPLCRPGDRRFIGQVTDVCGAVRHAGRSRSIPVRHPGRRMIEHDCNPTAAQQPGNNPAARQAGYPVGEEHDPDPPALEQGAGRDLTASPIRGATATPRGFNRAGVGLMAGYCLASALANSTPMRLPGASAIPAKPPCTCRQKITKRTGQRPNHRRRTRFASRGPGVRVSLAPPCQRAC